MFEVGNILKEWLSNCRIWASYDVKNYADMVECCSFPYRFYYYSAIDVKHGTLPHHSTVQFF